MHTSAKTKKNENKARTKEREKTHTRARNRIQSEDSVGNGYGLRDVVLGCKYNIEYVLYCVQTSCSMRAHGVCDCFVRK